MKYFKFRYLIISTLIISSAYVFNLTGCKSEDGIIDAGNEFSEETKMAKITSDLYTTLSKGLSMLIFLSNDQEVNSNGCPSVINSGGFMYGSLTVEYGNTPCVSILDNTRRSGRFIMDYMIDTTNTDSIFTIIRYDNFRIYKNIFSSDTTSAYITGSDTVRISRLSNIIYRFSMNIYRNIVSDDISYTVNLKDTSIVNINTFYDLRDDIYTVESYGTFYNNKTSVNHLMNIESPANLLISAECKYPISGILAYQSGSREFTADFTPNNSLCDEIFKIFKNNTSRNFTLSEISY